MSGTRVYVGNLSWQAQWQDLKDHMRGPNQDLNVLRADIMSETTGASPIAFSFCQRLFFCIKALSFKLDFEVVRRTLCVRERHLSDLWIVCSLSILCDMHEFADKALVVDMQVARGVALLSSMPRTRMLSVPSASSTIRASWTAWSSCGRIARLRRRAVAVVAAV